jgi:DNA-binding transcriptional LysR family regulator
MVLESFHSHHPKMQIDLEEALSTDIVSAIHSGKAELGITSGNTPRLGLAGTICDQHSLVVILYPGHPLVAKKSLHFSDVLPHELVALNQGSALLDLLEQQAHLLKRSMRIRVQVRSFDAICRLVASHLGIGVLPEPAARELASSLGLHIRPMKDAWAARELMLLVPQSELPAAACLLRDTIMKSRAIVP